MRQWRIVFEAKVPIVVEAGTKMEAMERAWDKFEKIMTERLPEMTTACIGRTEELADPEHEAYMAERWNR